MALQVNYPFRGITVPNAYMKIERVFGGKTEDWGSVVVVYPSKPEVVIPVFDEAGNDITPEPIPPIDTFNAGAKYSTTEPNAYLLIYQTLQAIFPDSVEI